MRGQEINKKKRTLSGAAARTGNFSKKEDYKLFYIENR